MDLEMRKLMQDEIEALVYADARAYFTKNPKQATELLKSANTSAPEGIDAIDLAVWTIVANVLLNLDETLMKG